MRGRFVSRLLQRIEWVTGANAGVLKKAARLDSLCKSKYIFKN